MPSLRLLSRRIRSVENTAKVTHAMELIAASKMRRAQNAVMAGRAYSEMIQRVMANLEAQPEEEEDANALLAHRTVKNIGVLHMTPDRGLCGGLHGNMNRALAQFILRQRPTPVRIIAVGRKGRDFMIRANQEVKAVYTNITDRPGVDDILPISQMVLNDYKRAEIDEVYLAYPQFVSTVSQVPTIKRLLPVEPADIPVDARVGYIYEPSASAVLDGLLPRFVEMQIFHALLELNASEQSARMVAMRNATDSANEMVDDLTLDLNRVRQDNITSELLDIIGGAAALEG
ncbi:ATP synthase F1 subunit gamma [SAR202 cluster bacterium AD-804-J14_MRT_500m]|nr:ATP synthase F1 subunit gamma [SAR202 cluster bacterium AD-804-J14_MRT_500m]